MLANASNVMPDELKFEGDKQFFTAALDRADLIVHGRNSYEDQPNSPRRKRICPDPQGRGARARSGQSQGHAVESGRRSFEAACADAGVRAGTVAIIGGPGVFGMFMDRYDMFWLSQAPHVRLPDGEPCFPGVPAQSPQTDPASARAARRRAANARPGRTTSPSRRGGAAPEVLPRRRRPARCSAAPGHSPRS